MSAALRVSEPSGGETVRVPPHSYDAERALLGALLMNNRAYERVSDFLLPEHMADPVNGRVYAACAALINDGRQANPVTLKSHLENDELLKAAGGMKYIASLAASAVTVINAGEYGRLVYDLYLRRELIAVGEDMVNDCFESEPQDSAMNMIEVAESRLFALTMKDNTQGFTTIGSAAVDAVKSAESAFKRDGALVGVNTGLAALNRRLGGLHNEDLIILAGRPSMGKTALATTMAYNAAAIAQRDSLGAIAYFSLEMGAQQLAIRILAHLCKLSVENIRNGNISQLAIQEMMDAQQTLDVMPLHIDDSPAPTVPQIRSRCRRLARSKKGLGLIILDYLQLITPTRIGREENRVQEISSITRGLKQLARELGVPVLALSQLSRAVDNREDKRPMLSDLRDSGTIEQDADVVQFVYREQYYLERSEPAQRADESLERYSDRRGGWSKRLEAASNIVEVITGKQRQGSAGTDRCHFDADTTWVSDLETRMSAQWAML